MAVGLGERRGADPSDLAEVEVGNDAGVIAAGAAGRGAHRSRLAVDDNTEDRAGTLAPPFLPERPHRTRRGSIRRHRENDLERILPLSEQQAGGDEAPIGAVRQRPRTRLPLEAEIIQ